MRHPEASHELLCISILFSEAEGSAPLHHKVITNCLVMGALQTSRADPSPRALSIDHDYDVACFAQDGAFKRTVSRERDTANKKTH